MYKTVEFCISMVMCRIILSCYAELFVVIDCILIGSLHLDCIWKLLALCGCLSPSYQLLTDLTTLIFRVISGDNFAKQMGVSQPKMANAVSIKIDQFLAHTGQERFQKLTYLLSYSLPSYSNHCCYSNVILHYWGLLVFENK